MQNIEKIRLIGTKALLQVNELTFEVFIVDFKRSYGKDRWLVKPVLGTGEKWVEKIVIPSLPIV